MIETPSAQIHIVAQIPIPDLWDETGKLPTVWGAFLATVAKSGGRISPSIADALMHHRGG